MTQHTLKSWNLYERNPCEWTVEVGEESETQDIALIMNWDNLPDSEVEANARLIAAAPDLLMGLELFIAAAHGHTTVDSRDLKWIEEAIAKAEGRMDGNPCRKDPRCLDTGRCPFDPVCNN